MSQGIYLGLRAVIATSIGFLVTHASDFSVQPSASLILEGWSLFDGGVETGETSLALLHLGNDFSFGATTQAHIGSFFFSGDNDVDAFTRDFGAYSNPITDSRYILFTAWLQSAFNDSTFKWEQLAADESFFVSETGSLFINANFGAIPIVSANVAAPIFSVRTLGAEHKYNVQQGCLQFGANAGDPGPGDKYDHGFNWSAGGDAGYFLILEKGLEYQLGPERNGVVQSGTYYHTGSFDSFQSSEQSKGMASFYAIVDQAISDTGAGFLRIGHNPDSKRSVVDRYLDIGSAWRLFPNRRPQDLFGIAYSYTRFSDSYTGLERLASNSRSEQVVEFAYSTQIANLWKIQPSPQWIIDPANATEDCLVGGLRFFREF